MSPWKPNLGGWLAILNCSAWVVLVFSLQNDFHPPDVLLAIGLIVLSLPVALPFMLPSQEPTTVGAICVCIIIGVNSFLWGYGLAAICRRCHRLIKVTTS